MLKNRIITALAIAFVALAAIFLLPLWAFSLFFLAAAGFGVFEWAGFAGLESLRAKLFYTGLFVLMAAGLYLLKAYFADFIGLVAMLWMCAIASIRLHTRTAQLWRRRRPNALPQIHLHLSKSRGLSRHSLAG
ncbi:hypothetical protein OAB62_07405 [Pseudomonadales bacterium]|nr:hypothetical protein [Pseudomonadales bacterium]